MLTWKCSIGIFLNDACNKLTWANNIGVYTKDDLSQIDEKLIDLRSGVNDIVNVWYHLNKFYMKKYTVWQNNVVILMKFTRTL